MAASATLPVPSNETAAAVTNAPVISKFLAVASEVAVPALPVKLPVTFPKTPPLALIAPVKVETPVTARVLFRTVCPVTSRPASASIAPLKVEIPLKVALLMLTSPNEAPEVTLAHSRTPF